MKELLQFMKTVTLVLKNVIFLTNDAELSLDDKKARFCVGFCASLSYFEMI